MKQIAAIFIGGGIAGALDITYAITVHFVTRGIKPIVILQSVASGVQGAEAYKGGVPSGLLGLGLHFFMTILMAIAYNLASKLFPVLTEKPVMAGAAYGVMLYFIMNYVVVPLSLAVPGRPPMGWHILGAMFAHTCLVAIPIALAASKVGR